MYITGLIIRMNNDSLILECKKENDVFKTYKFKLNNDNWLKQFDIGDYVYLKIVNNKIMEIDLVQRLLNFSDPKIQLSKIKI